MATYTVVSIDLSQVSDTSSPRELVARNRAISKVTVLRSQPGAIVNLHFGQSGEPVPIANQGMRFALCPPELDGLWASVPTKQSGTVKVLVSFTEHDIDAAGATAPGGGDLRTPTSPIVDHLQTPGSLNGPGIIQLLNPIGSGVLLIVYEWYIALSGAASQYGMRRTATPLNLAGGGSTIVNGSPVRLDERDTTPIKAKLQGTNFAAPPTFFSVHSDAFQPANEGQAGMEYFSPTRRPGSFPWTVKEGSALESEGPNGAGVFVRTKAVWDEA